MASECLIWRLFSHNPSASFVDCGTIFDWMLGNLNRREAVAQWPFLEQKYAPLFRR
jgi:hypothetical protein